MVPPQETGSFWVITTYFNPMRYRRRLHNYHVFRHHLAGPLLTVELSHNGHFDLTPDDADQLIQVTGGDVMWQKERLLNVALAALPASCAYVAWLDGDVVFTNPTWKQQTRHLLDHYPLVQPFKTLHDLPAEVSPETFDANVVPPKAFSLAYKMQQALVTNDDLRPAYTSQLRACSFGGAWAARKDLLDQHGFYDALIIGSGDRAMSCAAFGRFDDAIHTTCLQGARAQHYLAWARPFHDAVQGQVGYVDTPLLHLWHGNLKHRRYLERHQRFRAFNFDPATDLGLNAHGAWQWKSHKPAMHAFLQTYFAQRHEDGMPEAP